MCTLTWHTYEHGYRLLFTRDELRSRACAGPPSVRFAGDTAYVAPTDSDRGGTWIGVNELGITHCIVNTYGGPIARGLRDRLVELARIGNRGADTGTHRLRPSRGTLVRDLQHCDSPDCTEKALLDWPIEGVPDFCVLQLVPGGNPIAFLKENGVLYRSTVGTPPVTTSGHRTDTVECFRFDLFQSRIQANRGRFAADGHGGRRMLAKFHEYRHASDPALGVRMTRGDGRSVSLTSVEVDAASVSMGYREIPEHGAMRAVRAWTPAVSLVRRAGAGRPEGHAGTEAFAGAKCVAATGADARSIGHASYRPCGDRNDASAGDGGNRSEAAAEESRNRSSPAEDNGIAAGEPVFDLRRLFGERTPGFARRLPPGTFALLERILHIRLVNEVLPRVAQMETAEFCEYMLGRFDIRLRVEGLEHLDIEDIEGDGFPVFCSNHPSGAIEGVALIALIKRRYGSVLLPANEILGKIRPLAPVMVPIDRYRGNAAVAGRYAKAFASESPLLVFPAGRTARFRGGKLREFPWTKSFVTHARRNGRTICPVRVSGRNSARFYAIHRIRRALGIDLNFEMMLLVDELLRSRGSERTIRFGAVRPAAAVTGRDDWQRAETLRREVEFRL